LHGRLLGLLGLCCFGLFNFWLVIYLFIWLLGLRFFQLRVFSYLSFDGGFQRRRSLDGGISFLRLLLNLGRRRLLHLFFRKLLLGDSRFFSDLKFRILSYIYRLRLMWLLNLGNLCWDNLLNYFYGFNRLLLSIDLSNDFLSLYFLSRERLRFLLDLCNDFRGFFLLRDLIYFNNRLRFNFFGYLWLSQDRAQHLHPS
jgi:hypothetical protein